MKQHITKEQLNEFLEVKSKDDYNKIKYHNLYELICPSAVVCENFTIGNMIEILELNYPTLHIDKHLANPNSLQTTNYYEVFQQGFGSSYGNNLCDALWEAVKKILK